MLRFTSLRLFNKGLHTTLPSRVGTVTDWKLFKGYGFVQEDLSGEQFFCSRKATGGALFLRPGDAVRFDLEDESGDSFETLNIAGHGRCKIVTSPNGSPFLQSELQGIVMETPVPSKGIVGLICKVGKWSASMASSTTSDPSAAAAAQQDVAGKKDGHSSEEDSRLYHYSFSHSRALSVGDMVRFWSRENPLRRTAKDVVAVDPSILSPDETRLLEATRRLINNQLSRTMTANVKFHHQQWQPLREKAVVPELSGHDAERVDHTVTGAELVASTSTARMVACEVIHFQGRYGKLRVVQDGGAPLVIFFHADMANVPAGRVVVGMRGTCSYERVRQGKNAGTLRAQRVIF